MATKLSSTFTLTMPSDREIVMTRMFNAPRELVFEAYSKCEHLARWQGPSYLTMTQCEMDFRPGGAFRYVYRAPDGSEFGFSGEYREIVRPERMTGTFEFGTMPGHISINTMILEEINGQTKLTVTSLFQSIEDRDGMAQSGMEAGVREGWDRLEEILATME